VLGNTAILKIDGRGTEPAHPQQLQLLADDQAGRCPVDYESSDSLRSPLTINTRDDDEEVGELRARNEHLLPIENVVIVALGRGRLNGGCVGSRVWLGQAKAANALAAR
jgi:hypothetical protein